jgi:hypothetical protein
MQRLIANSMLWAPTPTPSDAGAPCSGTFRIVAAAGATLGFAAT